MTTSRAVRWGSIATLAVLPFALVAQGGTARGWRTTAPSAFTLSGYLSDRGLAEASGAAPSVANPGLFWTIGDSGNPPELLAIDSTGALRGRVMLANVANIDWEAVAVGRCPAGTCVYVGDVGDNAERRSEVMIHRIPEPKLRDAERVTVHGAETLRLRYPTQSHDVEAMGVTPEGDLLMVTKGRSGGVLAYAVAATEWSRAGTVTARRVDSLPIVPHSGTGRLVTDLAITTDGSRVVVRTYRDLFVFDRAPDGALTPNHACDIVGREPQGEGVAWLPGGRLLLVSERGFFQRGTVNIASCS